MLFWQDCREVRKEQGPLYRGRPQSRRGPVQMLDRDWARLCAEKLYLFSMSAWLSVLGWQKTAAEQLGQMWWHPVGLAMNQYLRIAVVEWCGWLLIEEPAQRKCRNYLTKSYPTRTLPRDVHSSQVDIKPGSDKKKTGIAVSACDRLHFAVARIDQVCCGSLSYLQT